MSAVYPIIINKSPAEVADIDSRTIIVKYLFIFLEYKEFTITLNSFIISRQFKGIRPKLAIIYLLKIYKYIIYSNNIGYLDWLIIKIIQNCSHKSITYKTCL